MWPLPSECQCVGGIKSYLGSPTFSDERHVRKLSRCLSLVAAVGAALPASSLTSCKRPDISNSVIASAVSSDSSHTGILVRRAIHAALSSDQYLLVILQRGATVEDALADPDIGDSAIFVGTNAQAVHLQWLDSSTLQVLCDSCGMTSIDVQRRLTSHGEVGVIYSGVPAE